MKNTINQSNVNTSTLNNNGNIKNFVSLSLPSVSDDKPINNTFDFLCVHKEEIESESNDYQTALYYLFYNQAYNCYDGLLEEYSASKSKLKLDILETRLNNTLNRITVLYEQQRMQDILIFSKNQIDLTVSTKTKATKKSYDSLDFIPDVKLSPLDRLEQKYLVKYIIEKVGKENYNRLTAYYTNKDETKTNAERSKTKRILQGIQSVII